MKETRERALQKIRPVSCSPSYLKCFLAFILWELNSLWKIEIKYTPPGEITNFSYCFLTYFLFNLLISHKIRATTITIPITPTHTPALKIEPMAAQLLRHKAIRKKRTSIFLGKIILFEFKFLGYFVQ